MTSAQEQTLKANLARLLTQLRGDASRSAAARTLGVARQTLIDLEEANANPTLGRLDGIGRAYGVRFELRAFDLSTGREVKGAAGAILAGGAPRE